jgi:hypothetical protein
MTKNYLIKEAFMTLKQFFLNLIYAILLMCLFIACSSSEDASIAWSDDFDDGDLDGWDVWYQKGLYSVDDGVLTIKTGGDLYQESTVLNGTWSFDLYFDNNSETTHEFRFTEGTYNFQNLEVKQAQNTQIWITTQRDDGDAIPSYVDLGERLSDWHHIDITREDIGLIKVYLDGEFILEHFDDREFDAEKLVVMYCCSGPVLDNLVVRDQIIEFLPEN